jgi:hypothetical protein
MALTSAIHFRLANDWRAREGAEVMLSDIKDDLNKHIAFARDNLKSAKNNSDRVAAAGSVKALVEFKEYLDRIVVVE